MYNIDNSDMVESLPRKNIRNNNPFPGLRPFSKDESHLFFGREGQSEDVLLKLAQNHFVAIIGPSGSGKSSFIHCGLIPVLYGGYLENVGTDWNVVLTRPGNTPVENLAEALASTEESYLQAEDKVKNARKEYFSNILRSHSTGLITAVSKHASANKNFLILIDQFEEFFRNKKGEESVHADKEPIDYIDLLLEAISHADHPIYIVLSMRSDFIGECAHFSKLTDKINTSSYLIPQMTWEQKRMAIVGPVAVGGGQITTKLVQRLLTDLGENPDQLPILQHALMRTWNYWSDLRELEEPIDVHHYEAIGCMEEALSQHANEAFDELTETQKWVCEVLFKTITERGTGAGIRRPTKLSEIAAIAGTSEQEVKTVVEAFRQPGRALLTPWHEISLQSHSVIDISHESLMRIWVRLTKWVDEESEAVKMYLKLCDAAAKYQIGQAGLWRPPDLQLALNWQAKQKPTLYWAQRYDPAFERAMAFLEYSITAYTTEQKTKEILQKRSLKRTRMVALILGLSAIISIGFLIFAITQQVRAREQAELAKQNEKQAKQQTKLAQISEKNAKDQKAFAEQQKEVAQMQEMLARESERRAKYERTKALFSEREARKQQLLAMEQRMRAESNEQKAIEEHEVALKERNNAYNLRLLSIAQAMAVKSLQVTDADVKVLLAQQSYLFNVKNGGREDDAYIYDGLYYATKKLKGDAFNHLAGHSDLVRSLAASSTGNIIYSAGSDGKILRFDANNLQKGGIFLYQNTGIVNRSLALSSDNNILACVGEMSYLQLFQLKNPGSSPAKIKIPLQQGWFVSFTREDKGLVFSDSTTVYHYDFDSFKPILSAKSKINTIALSPYTNNMAIGNRTGQVILIDLEANYQETILFSNNLPVTAIAYSHDGKILAAGDQAGTVRVWNIATKELIATLRGHTARVNNIRFSWDNKKIATGSWDKTVMIWNAAKLTNQPIVLRDYNTDWVWSIAFSSDGEKLLAGCKDKFVRVWPTSTQLMANEMCNKIKRNMTSKEWELYVADDIPYERTCEAQPVTNKILPNK